jgi:PIN domain
MKNVFIDSQVWLSLYDFSSDDLEQFRKLNDLIDEDVKIYLTQQVYEEVKRNRENKIKESLSKFRSFNIQIPNLCKGYDEYRTFKTLAENMQNTHRDLIKKVESDIQVERLHADYVINEIFEKLKIIERSDVLINKAIIRYDIGNPPGKERSYGDGTSQ